MKVRAVASGTDRSNAIGTVEIECEPDGLTITYLGVGAYSEGFAPGALTHGTRVRIPWEGVLEARAEGDRLYLAVEPRLTPHHRLCLTGFSSRDVVDPRELFRQRLVIWVGAGGAAVVGMLLVGLTVPRISPEAGGATAIGLGLLIALLLLLLGWVAELRLTRGADPDAVRLSLLGELGVYLPQLSHGPAAPPRRATPEPILLAYRAMPRTTVAFALTLSAGLLGAILTVRWVVSGGAARRHDPQSPVAARSLPPEAPDDVTAPAGTPVPTLASPPPDPTTGSIPTAAPDADSVGLGGDCRCIRADSPLWRDGLPRLSLLVLSQRPFQRGTKRRLAAEVAVVNNGDQAIAEVSLVVHFFEQDPPPSNRRYEVAQRALYFEGPLTAAQAIKWSVEARGTSLEVESRDPAAVVSPGTDTAPANLAADLLEANHRPVRLHGAMLLAYLGDPRARQAATDLRDALRDDEEPYLTRLLRATEEVRVCDLRVEGTADPREVSGCVFNSGAALAENAGVRVRALAEGVSHQHPLAPPPTVVEERKWRVGEPLPAGSGRRFSARWALGPAGPTTPTFEAYAGRFDLLD